MSARQRSASLMQTSLFAAMIAASQAATALIIVDTQLCFTNELNSSAPYAECNPPATGGTDQCSREGSLGVASGSGIVPLINQLRTDAGCLFDVIVRTQDYHPAGHISFGSTHFGNGSPNSGFSFLGGPLPYVGYPVNVHCTRASSLNIDDAQCCLVDTTQPACTALGTGSGGAGNPCVTPTDPNNAACTQCAANMSSCIEMPQAMWTDHCVQSGDAGFATGLLTPDTDVIVQKGTNMYIDAYSAFMDNAKIHRTSLHSTLQAYGVDTIYVTGIATDFCVSWTATDAVDLGYTTTVITDATAPIALPAGNGTTVDVAYAAWATKGVSTRTVAEMLAMSCPVTTNNNHQSMWLIPILIIVILAILGAVYLCVRMDKKQPSTTVDPPAKVDPPA